MIRLKKLNLKLPARAALWYLATSATTKAVGFLITPFFTRMIDGQAYGELTLYLSLLGMASVSSSAVNSSSVIYKEMKKHDKDKESFLRSALIVSLAFSAAICLLLFTLRRFFALPKHLFIPLSLQILCDGTVAVILSSAKYSYHYKEVALITLISSVLPAIITLIMLKTTNVRFRVRIYALLAISVCLAVYALVKILRTKGRASKNTETALLKSALPLMPHSILTALSGQADKLIITFFFGAVSLAKYSVVHSLGIALQFAVSALGSALGPWMIRKLEGGKHKELSNLTGILLSAFSALSLVLIALAPEAMKILAPREYLDAFPAFLPLALSTPVLLLSSVITVCLVHLGFGKKIATVSIIGAVVNLILNFMLIPKLSYLGAGLAIFLSQLSSTLMGLYYLLGSKLSRVLTTKRIFKTVLPTIALGLLLFLLFEFPALRVFLLTIPAVMMLNDYYSLKGLIVE